MRVACVAALLVACAAACEGPPGAGDDDADGAPPAADAAPPLIDAAPPEPDVVLLPDAAPPADAGPPGTLAVTLYGTSLGGRVVSTPAGIDCPGSCAATFTVGESVTLTAAPATSLAGWSGLCLGILQPCTLTVPAEPASVGATFAHLRSPTWTKLFDGAEHRLLDMTAIAGGALLLGGFFDNPVDFGLGALTPTGGDGDAFLLAADADGDPLWQRTIPGSGHTVVLELAARPGGGAVMIGAYSGTVDEAGTMLLSTGSEHFVLTVDAAGASEWLVPVTGAGSLHLAAGDDGDVYLSARHQQAVDLAGTQVPHTGFDDALLIARLDGDDGSVKWVRSIAAGNWQSTGAIDVDAAGNLFLAAGYRDATDLGCGEILPVALATSFVVARLAAADGDCVWSWSYGGGGEELAGFIDVNRAGSFVVGGGFRRGSTLDLGDGAVTAGGDGLFVVGFTQQDGAHLWSHRIEADSSAGIGQVHLRDLVYGDDGRVDLVGALNFGGAISLGPITVGDGRGVFVARATSAGFSVTAYRLLFGRDSSPGMQAAEIDATPLVRLGGAIVVAIAARGLIDSVGGGYDAKTGSTRLERLP